MVCFVWRKPDVCEIAEIGRREIILKAQMEASFTVLDNSIIIFPLVWSLYGIGILN